MEQDINLTTLFLLNLHASWSFHLRVPACPRNRTTQELRNLAHKACTKQKTIGEETVKNPKVSVSEHCLELTLDGALQHHSHRHFYRESIPFQASRGQHSAATSETAEILRVLKVLLHMKTHKEDEPSTQNTARHLQTTELTVTAQSDNNTQAPQSTAAHPERDSTGPHTRYHKHKVPENAVLTTCLRSELHKTGPHHPPIVTPALMPTFLGSLVKKGVGRKGVNRKDLIDTGSNLTVISSHLFKRLQFEAKRQDQTLTPQNYELNVQVYRQNDIQFEQVVSIHLTIVPMSLIHPMYVPPMNTHALLIDKDLLEHFDPFLNFKQLKDFAQVREPFSLQPHRLLEPDCQVAEVTGTPTEPDGQVTEVTGTPAASHEYNALTTGSSSCLCTLVNKKGTVVPAYTKGVPVRLNLQCDQTLHHTLGFFQSSPECVELGLTLANNKHVKHQHLFQQCDNITKTHNVIVYWKKVTGHSKLPSLDKDFKDHTDTLAKTGTLNNILWSLTTHPPTFKVEVITHSIRTLLAKLPTSESLTLAPLSTHTNIADMRASETSIMTLLYHLSDPSIHPGNQSTVTDNQSPRPLHDTQTMLRAQNNIVGCAPSDITMPGLVMPRGKRGIMPIYFHDAACAAPRSTRATDKTLKQASCQQQDVAKHGRGRAKPSRRPRSKETVRSNQRQALFVSFSPFSLSLPIICTRMLLWFAVPCCQPKIGQLPPRKPLRLLTTDDRAHYPSTVTEYSCTRFRWKKDSLTHTEADVKHMFSQHEKVTVTQMELSGHHHRSKQFPGALLRAAAAARMFNIVMSSVNAANQTVNSLKPLFTVFQKDFTQTQLFTALTTDMLWEVSSSNDSLTTSKTPPYMIPLSLVLTVPSYAITIPADLQQIHLANSLDSAFLRHVNPKQREVNVLLNQPISKSSQVYRPKDIVSVRMWKSNTHTKTHIPNVVAYHDSDTQLYLAPNMHMCALSKDIHYLCLSKPFLRHNSEGICELQPWVSDTCCPAEAKPLTQVTETQAEIVGNRWLVNTPVRSATLTYDQHDTATRANLLDQVLKGTTQHIEITPVDTALQAQPRQPVLNQSSAVRAWNAPDTARCISTVIGPALTLGVTFILYRILNGCKPLQPNS
ncbi:uncharacterized protein LOC127958674 [Carassius gibelio]|uniref:uncharacterized protein LOC127958674 n=1 Tax=Carassius gibelio TaxID=101364 RepID=UPI00227898C6|nr:uncharacterized protein LOC127958674 [Carassius gibelio]